MVTVRSVSTSTSTAAGSDACSCGSSALMRSTTSMTLAPGWRWMFRMTAGVVFAQAASLRVLGAVDDRRDVAQPDRRAVLVGDDQVRVVVGGLELVVGVDRGGARRAVEAALGAC